MFISIYYIFSRKEQEGAITSNERGIETEVKGKHPYSLASVR